MKKIVAIDVKEANIPVDYLNRIKKQTDNLLFTTRDNPEILSQVADADGLLVSISTKIDQKLIDAAPQVRYIGVGSTAYNAIDIDYVSSKKIIVSNLGGYSTEAVAEFFFAVLFEKVRELEKAKLQARSEDYSFTNFMGYDLKSSVLGVIGAGRIGSRIAEIGIGIGMDVIYFSRNNKPEIDKLGAKKVTLDQVLSQSDYLSLNLALNTETTNIINSSKIDLLKSNCVFINLSPPKLIDQEKMMIKASIGEVTYIFDHSDDIEPELAKKYLNTPNCIVYPPVAFRTVGANTARWETFVSNIENFIKEKPTNIVSDP